MKLKAAIILFLQAKRIECSPKTIATYEYSLNKMSAYVGDREIETITPHDLINYVTQLTKADGSPLARDSEDKEIKTCKVLFNWLLKLKLIPFSPMDGIRPRPKARRIDRSKAMPKESFLKIRQTLIEMRMYRELALMDFLWDTMARAGGVANLRIADIDFSTNTAYVIEKGDKQRRVAFGDECAKSLQRWIRRRKGKTDFVFQSGNRSFSAEAVGSMVRRCCILAGVKPQQSHSIRHAGGHRMADAGVAPSVAATALGHESVLTTLKHYYPQDEERALKAMRDNALGATHVIPSKVINLPKKITG